MTDFVKNSFLRGYGNDGTAREVILEDEMNRNFVGEKGEVAKR